MKTIDFSYFIERYNSGEMNDAEKQWFRKELDGNEKLRKEVMLRKQTDEILKNQNIVLLRNKLSEIEKRREESVPAINTGKKGRFYLNYAAVIAGLIIIASIALFSGKKASSEEIIGQYYKSYEPPASPRSVTAKLNDDFTSALEYYNTHDYATAAVYFNKVGESHPKYMESVLLSGISYYEENKFPEAKQSFMKVINNNDNLCIETAKWYLALCYIRTEEKEKANKQLEIIRTEGGLYSNNAKKIIKKIR